MSLGVKQVWKLPRATYSKIAPKIVILILIYYSNLMETLKSEDTNDATSSYWKSHSTLSDKENEFSEVSSLALAR